MTLGTCYEVVVRYLFNAPTPWSFDVSYITYGTLFMMAGAYTLSRGGHVRGDFIYRSWPPRWQARVDFVLYFLFFFPGVLALIITGWKYAARSWGYGEVSISSPAGVPIYQLKSVIVAAGLLLLIQGIAQVVPLPALHADRRVARPGGGRSRDRRDPDRGGASRRGLAEDDRMTEPQVALLMLGIFIVTIFLGFPIAFTMMAMGVLFGYWAYFDPDRMWRSFNRLDETATTWDQWSLWFEGFFNNRIFDLFINQTYTVISNDVLTAIPLFLFMGYIVERANIVTRLFTTLEIAAKNVPGSLGVAALITCSLFATATGIVGAVVTLMGLLALPQMLKARYDPAFASGIIAAGGTLGILIPPSIMLIVYAATSGVSIVRLYAGALLPGFLLVGLYIGYVMLRSMLQPSVAPRPAKGDIPEVGFGRLLWMIVTSFLPLAILILAVLGAILFGLATPSEAAAVGAAGGVVLAVAYRALTWARLRELVYLTARTTAMVCWLFVGSATFASVFAYLGGDRLIAEFVIGMDLTPLTFLLMAQLVIFILGWPLEWTEIIIIFVPIFLPLLAALRHRPAVLRHPRRAEPADRVPVAADGDVGLLPQGHRAAGGHAEPDLRRLHAVPAAGAACRW